MQEKLYLVRSLLLTARSAMAAAGAPEVDRALDLVEDCIEMAQMAPPMVRITCRNGLTDAQLDRARINNPGDDEYADIFRAFESGIEPPITVDEFVNKAPWGAR